MVGAFGRLKIVEVAVDTVVADPVEAELGFGSMAICAGGHSVCTQERKTIVLMQFRNKIHQPVFSIVATGTVHAQRLLVDIRMAGKTIGFCL